MADDAATATEEAQITFNVKAANDQKHVLTLASTTTVADLKTKLSTSEYADIPAERQRLIYSGRVLKDHDTLAGVKIKDGHTVHLVKGAASNARQNPANQGTSTSSSGTGTPTPQVPTNIAAGTGNNPLAGLTGARYAGFHGLPGADMFGPDGGMGPPPNPEQMLEMMDNPQFLQQMNEAMNNPQVIELMQQNPMVRNNPMISEMLRNPEMRRMMFNPEMMRMQLQMQRAMNPNGGGSSFPMPGATNTTPQQDSAGTQNQGQTGSTPQQDPLAALFGGAGAGAGAGANPFANLFGPGGANPFATPTQTPNTSSTPTTGTDTNTSTTDSTQPTESAQNTSSPPPNPFASLFGAPPASAGAGTGAGAQQPNPIAEMTRNLMQNPDAMRAAMQMMGNMNGSNPSLSPFGQPPAGTNPSDTTGGTANPPAANPFAALFGPGGGFGAPAAPADNRPPEEVYEAQLRQLNEMGFYEFDRNVSALRRSGGNVQGAIEYLLSGGS